MRTAVRCVISLRNILLALLFFSSGFSLAQQTIVKGKITDSNSGDPVPFVNVIFQNTGIGTTTDFDGNYTLKASTAVDSVVVSYIGYKPKTKAVQKGISQIINFQLEEEVIKLSEIVVEAGENPAFEILRKVVKNKSKNDKRKLTAYEYDSYTKIEVDVDNISEKFRQKKIMKKISQVMDSIDLIAGEDGKPILPLFISEGVSKFYYRDNPQLRYENILKTKINGVGIEDGSLVTQLVGSSFQEYNFYQNWLNIVNKEFVSPIADGWRIYYEYDLTDSVYIGDHFCYRLDFYPKSPQDLAFTGTMWITKKDYALKQIDVSVGKQANLNFIEKIKIQQELNPTTGGAWVPIKSRILVDVSEISNGSAGMLAKFYISNKNVVADKPYDPSFYHRPIKMEEDARMYEEEKYWDTLRHEPLSETEKSVYRMIDTLQNIPVVKTYTDIIKIAVDGYYKTGKVFLGPYISVFALNNIEGVHLQAGFKTNINFSNKWVLGGQLGYGFKDEKIKYSAFVQRILSRERWTTVSLRVRSDLGRVGIDDEVLADNLFFLAFQRYGNFRRGYYFNEVRFNLQRELFKGFSQRIAFKYSTFNPIFNFGYYDNPQDPTSIQNYYQTSELILESRFAKDELFLQNDNERRSLGTSKWPIITLRYTHGFKDVLGGYFDYDKLKLNLKKRIKMGPLGVGRLNVTGEYIFNALPYTLLSPHLGNQSPIYTGVTYNLMNYGEFISDHFVSVQYQQHFEGLFFNRIPLLQKLKWRVVGTANVLYGGMRQENRDLIAKTTSDNVTETVPAGYLTTENPFYVELGYGVENIFKFLRIDFVHRLSPLMTSDPNASIRKFGVLFSFEFTL